jgi:hypothetical protein
MSKRKLRAEQNVNCHCERSEAISGRLCSA